MYIKWIVCTVKHNREVSFSEAQEKWADTKFNSGFIGQTGGWTCKKKREACILSIWQDKDALSNFMKAKHDNIYLSGNQKEDIEKIEVAHFNLLFNMPGALQLWKKIIEAAKFLRIADCIVFPDRKNHFENAQKDVWLPGMQYADGMLGGLFANNDKNKQRYLVATCWSEDHLHDTYTEKKVPLLRDQAQAKADIRQIAGKGIYIVPEWKVVV